jgi:mRNA-degrading endonuclease HigB of HigAB toxin-antitoxin module
MKTIKENKRNTAIPGHPMTETEFKDFIKAGEKGSFMSPREFKRKFDMWKKGLENYPC